MIFFHLSLLFFSVFVRVFSQEKIIGTAPGPVGTGSFIFSPINTQSTLLFLFFFPRETSPHPDRQQLAINPSLCWKSRNISSHNSLPKCIVGSVPAGPCSRRSPLLLVISLVLHAEQGPRSVRLKEAFHQQRPEKKFLNLFLGFLFFHCKNYKL